MFYFAGGSDREKIEIEKTNNVLGADVILCQTNIKKTWFFNNCKQLYCE